VSNNTLKKENGKTLRLKSLNNGGKYLCYDDSRQDNYVITISKDGRHNLDWTSFPCDDKYLLKSWKDNFFLFRTDKKLDIGTPIDYITVKEIKDLNIDPDKIEEGFKWSIHKCLNGNILIKSYQNDYLHSRDSPETFIIVTVWDEVVNNCLSGNSWEPEY
jgi:hypothetical protein